MAVQGQTPWAPVVDQIAGGSQPHGQDGQIKYLFLGPALGIGKTDADISCRFGVDAGDPGADQADAVALGLFQISFKIFARRAQVHVENGGCQVDVTQFSGNDRFLETGGAADGGAIATPQAGVSGADTLDEGNAGGRLASEGRRSFP